ncbi:hypothetical protein CR513_26449, partial [Mucuna pruriens]
MSTSFILSNINLIYIIKLFTTLHCYITFLTNKCYILQNSNYKMIGTIENNGGCIFSKLLYRFKNKILPSYILPYYGTLD